MLDNAGLLLYIPYFTSIIATIIDFIEGESPSRHNQGFYIYQFHIMEHFLEKEILRYGFGVLTQNRRVQSFSKYYLEYTILPIVLLYEKTTYSVYVLSEICSQRSR